MVCRVYSLKMFNPLRNNSILICGRKIQNTTDRVTELSLPYMENHSRGTGGWFVGKAVYKGICADLHINTNKGEAIILSQTLAQ